MTLRLWAGALALACGIAPIAAHADDPNDRSMHSAAARARDAAIIRKMNLDQLAYVRQRDAGYAAGWQAYRHAQDPDSGYAAQRAEYDRAQARYRDDRARYDRQMAEWRHAVAACEAGQDEYCDR